MDRSELRFGVATGLGVLGFLVFVGILYQTSPAIVALGLVLGLLSALIAMGLVLVYRANRVVNFAQGDIGGVAAILAASLIVGPGWPFFLAAGVGLAAALALGAAIEVLVVRRFAKAPRLLLTVATIGVAQILQVAELGLPQLFSYDVIPQPPQPFHFRFQWFPVTFNGGHLLILLVVPVAAGVLAVFFRRTRIGIAVRASAESSDRASLLGIPVKRINTLVWTAAGGLSGLAVLLRMPIQGVAIGTPLGPSLLLRALAAAVIGKMENLPRTVVAALVLSVVEQTVFYSTGSTIVADAVLFGIIIGALLLQRRGSEDRARDIGASSWQSLREVRPIPRELAALPEVRWTLRIAGALLGAYLLIAPLSWTASRVNLFGIGLILAIVMCSLVVLTGWAGQISLGQLAIVAFGAAAAGSLAVQGKDFFLCIGIAGLVGAGVAVAIGLPALKIKGPFLAVTTLAFALTTGTYLLNHQYFPWLMPSVSDRVMRPVVLGKFNLESEHAYYYVILVAFALTCASVSRMRKSRTGRMLVANRDNTRAAQSYGISPIRAQLAAFALSGFLAGIAGGLYVFHQHGVSSTVLDPVQDLFVFSIGVIGGLGSVPGALLAAAYLTWVDFSPFTRETLSRLFASGVGVLLILLIRPDGLGGALYSARDGLLRRLARAKGIAVPSLLADARVEDAAPGNAPVDVVDARSRSLPSDHALLVVDGLEVSYGKAQVLFGVDFHVEPGEIVALLGTNGAGKSTLLSAICGLVHPSAGSVTYAGTDITGADPVATVAGGVVLMPGGKGVFPTLTVEENIQLAGWLYQREPEYLATATEQVLEFFPVLRDRWSRRAGNLSGGEQQMLTLAQAFIARPRLLMIDELSLGLAPIVVERLLEIVKAIHANGTTIVLVEQSVNVAITLAQRAVFLEKGEVRFDGPTAELLEHPEILRAVFLEGGARASTTPAVAARHGHRHFAEDCDECGRHHDVALELRGVSAGFGGVRAVDGVDLTVREGQVVGIIGPNGAGKTTVLDLISGFVVPSTGRILLGETDVTDLPPDERSMRGLGRSFQDARLFPSMTVRQAIATACERHVEVRDPIASLLLSPAVVESERKVDEDVSRLVELMNLGAYADKFVGELSTGTRRIVDLACTLAHRPSVLLLDEPSSGIAQRETEALGPVLLDIRDQTGAALVVIEHDIPLVTAISDQLVALELGAVIATGDPADVISDPRVVEGYLGGTEAVIHRSGSGGGKRRKRPLVAGRR